MKLRIEFFKSHSHYFGPVLALCRAVPGFQETGEGAAKKYAVEFDDYTDRFQDIARLCSSWRGAFFFINGHRVHLFQIHRFFGDPVYHEKNRLKYLSGDDLLAELRNQHKPHA